MAGPNRDPIDGGGVYLTDEVFLFRVAGVGAETVELEDCYRLDSVRVPLTAVRARRLRVVIPAPPRPETSPLAPGPPVRGASAPLSPAPLP